MRADLLTDDGPRGIHAGELAPLFPDGVPRKSLILFIGGPGAGKSRTAMRLGSRLGHCAVASLEMPRALCRESARSCGADLRRLYIAESLDAAEEAAREVHCTALLLDSAQASGRVDRRAIHRVQSWARATNGIGLVISQINRDGQAAGGPALVHEVDAVVTLKNRGDGTAEAHTRQKNRYAPPASVVLPLGSEGLAIEP